jgi:hypothetical protein
VHATLALANPDMLMRDGRWIILALGNFFLPEAQVVDSLPLEESSASPPLSCAIEPKVISLLNFVPLTPSELHALPVTSTSNNSRSVEAV